MPSWGHFAKFNVYLSFPLYILIASSCGEIGAIFSHYSYDTICTTYYEQIYIMIPHSVFCELKSPKC